MYADRVQETTISTGTSTITLDGAVAGFRSFSSAFANGDTVRYAIAGGSEWEVGEGIYTAGTILRGTDHNVFSSSNGGAAVNFGAQVKAVWVDLPAPMVADFGRVIAMRALLANQ